MMRNMKYSMTFGIALVCVMLFTACNDVLEPPQIQTPVNAYGRIRISFAGEEAAPQTARTVLPSTTFYQYMYTFTKKGEQNGVIKAPGSDGFFALEVGSYTVEVQAFTGNAASYTLAATGVSSEFSVGPGSNNPVEVVLTGVGAGAHGEFSYTITYPAGAAAEITLHKWPGLDTITLNPVNVAQGNGKTQTLQLETGSYLLTVLVSKTGLYAGISEAVHIYPSLATAYTKNYVENDLLPKFPGAAVSPTTGTSAVTATSITVNAVTAPTNGQTVEYGINTTNTAPSTWQAGLTFSGLSGGVYYIFARSAENDDYTAGAASASLQMIIVTNTDQWNTALTAIRNGGSGTAGNLKAYTVMVFGNVAVPGSAATGTSFGSVQYIAVTLKGSGTLSLSGSGSILRLGSNQTLIIDSENLTLQGRSGNNTAVMYVSGGALELKNGAISGNTSSASGGGVYLSGGAFTMSGGTISGNTASGSSSSGGGVYLSSGSFAMSGGAISGNTAGYRGGGVYVVSPGSFTMTGGIVYGSDAGSPLANTAGNASNGAALYVASGTARYGDASNILPHTDNQSSYTNNTIIPGVGGDSPVSDYDISGTGTFTYDGIAKTVSVTRKENAPPGAITVLYNGTETHPVNVGTYTVTFNVAAAAGFHAMTGLRAGTVTITRANGAAVSAPTGTSSVTGDSITVNAVTAPANGQTVEYARNTSNSAPSSGWQESTTFSGLTAGATYYIFARSKENTNYNTGAASSGYQVTTHSYGISLNPSGTHTFTAAAYGYGTPSARSVTVSNNGNQATGALTVALSGTNAGNFTLSTASINNIAAGGDASFTVVPITGLNAGTAAYTATVTVSGANGISAALNVSFTVNKAAGAAVSAPTGTSTVTGTSITVNAVTAPANGQTVEYARNTSNSAPSSGWQDSTTFSGLTAGTTYYIFARSKENANYNAGTASASLQVTRITVTFSINSGSGTTPNAETVAAGSSITLPSGSEFSRTGYTFGGWNTNSFGTGTNYDAGSSYTVTGTITLYARWYRTVTFEANGATSGTAPASQTANVGSSITLPDIGNLTRTGYTFGGWNTNTSGTGTNYNAGASYTPNGNNVTLYARWYSTVTIDANGATSWTTPDLQTANAGSSITLPGVDLTRTGYTFGGWNTNADGTGTNYDAGSSYTPAGNITLYARWYSTVSFDANGATGGTAPDLQMANAGSSVTLPGVGNLTRTGYTFGGWNTNAFGTGTNYNAGSSYPPTGNITLYARWYSIVSFNANGATSGTAPFFQTANAGSSITLPSEGNLLKTGYTFGGWNTQADGNGTNRNASSSYTPDGDIILYAKWTQIVFEMIYVPGGSFQMGNTNYAVDGYYDGTPVHTVTLTSFYMGKYEVTGAQYKAVMGSIPMSDYQSGGNYPVSYVSWYDAVEFCNKLSEQEGLTLYYTINKATGSDPNNTNTHPDELGWLVTRNTTATGYRLPTEAQWEYAAKGGNGSPGNYIYAGSNTADDVAWYNVSLPRQVGTKAPNGLGLYDMSGNVSEWCWDWYGDYSSSAQTDPLGASSGSDRVMRGGHYYALVGDLRSASRHSGTPTNMYSGGYNFVGFRIVRPAQ